MSSSWKYFLWIVIDDELVKNAPSPLMGEGWGEGEYSAISTTYIPLPFVPSRQGRGNLTFYEFINYDELVKSRKVRHCERSEAISQPVDKPRDCFVALLLAMTKTAVIQRSLTLNREPWNRELNSYENYIIILVPACAGPHADRSWCLCG